MTSKTTPPTSPKAERKAKAKAAALAALGAERRRKLVNVAVGLLAAVLLIGGLFLLYRSSQGGSPTATSGGSGKYVYQVGKPGPGEQAIDFTLPSTRGGQVSLAALRGKTVLTYWHEGLGCQPCWDQIRDVEKDMAKFRASGIDEFLSITSGPTELIARKMSDERLQSVALADSDLAVSKQYAMNQYGMMGDSRDGHTFLLVGPDGKILWRADYGGAPNYTMYVPVDRVLADMKAGRAG